MHFLLQSMIFSNTNVKKTKEETGDKKSLIRIVGWFLISIGKGLTRRLILGKKVEMTEGRKASRASKSTPPPPPLLAQGLNPPLSRSNSVMTQYLKYLSLGTMCNKTNLKQ